MEAARRLGISLRRFHGWVPRRESRQRGDVLVQWVESEWTSLERGWMLALAAYEDSLCPACGGPRDECQSIDADDGYEAQAVRCHRRTAISRAIEARQDTPQLDALLWVATRGRR